MADERPAGSGAFFRGEGRTSKAQVGRLASDPGLAVLIVASVFYFGALALSWMWPGFIFWTPATKVVASLVLMFLALRITNGDGVVLSLTIIAWYIFYGHPIPTSVAQFPGYIVSILLPLVLLYVVLLFFRWRWKHRKAASEGVTPEDVTFFGVMSNDLTGALLPIIFFLFDIGILEFLNLRFNLELLTTFSNFIYYLPLWMIYGAFTTKKEGFLISAAKTVAFIWLIAGILIFLPQIPTISKGIGDSSPDITDIAKAKDSIKGQSKTFLDTFQTARDTAGCNREFIEQQVTKTKKTTSEQSDFVKRCLRKIEIARLCEEEVKKGLYASIEACKKEKTVITTKGTTDITADKTELKASIPSGQTLTPDNNVVVAKVETSLPANKKEITATVTCKVDKTAGVALPDQLTFKAGEQHTSADPLRLECRPSGKITNKRLDVEFQILTKGTETSSYTAQIPVGFEKDEIDERSLAPKAPADLVQIYVGMASSTAFFDPLKSTSKPIEKGETILVAGTITDKGSGKISGTFPSTTLHSTVFKHAQKVAGECSKYTLNREKGTLSATNLASPQKNKKTVSLPNCRLQVDNDIPENLYTLEPQLAYDYEITAKGTVTALGFS